MMVRYLDDYEQQCRRCKGGCAIEGMSGSIVCTGFNAMTNADRIRAMTDEELAKFISGKARGFGEEYEGYMSALDWLKEEYKNE